MTTSIDMKGGCNLFMLFEPLRGWRHLKATQRRTRQDWAWAMKELVDVRHTDAQCITAVLDNLNTHTGASLYEISEPAEARRIWERLDLHYIPKHGSWPNMDEVELSASARQCLNRRIPYQHTLQPEVAALQAERNRSLSAVNGRFTSADARIKLKRLYRAIGP